ncbi:hypothetical protein Tco_1355756 [Tanacetum coccineum]
MSNQTNELKNMMASFFQMNTASSSGSGSLPGNTIANPNGELKAITTRSGLVLDGPSVPMPLPFINQEEDERAEETLTDPELAEYTIKVLPPLVQKSKPPSLRNYVVHQRDPRHPHIPYPSRMNQEKQQEKDEIQIHKFWQMFKQLHINITLADALIPIPKYQKMLKSLLSNKEKLLELTNTPLNENYSVVILKKLPEKLGDPGKFLIPCGFSELKCKALADLGERSSGPLSWEDPLLRTLVLDCCSRRRNDSRDGDDYLEDLFATNHLSGNPTLILDLVSSSPNITSLRITNHLSGNPTLISDPIFSFSPTLTSLEESDLIWEEFEAYLVSDSFLPGNNDLPFDIESDLREIEYLLNHDPTKEMDYILEDSVDEGNLADPNNDLVDTIPEMFTDEHTLDYSSPPLYDDVDDDLVELESDNDDVYDDPFDFKEDKIKESKLLIGELDPPRSSDFLPSQVTIQATPNKNVKKISISNASLILEDFNPPLYELPFHKEVPGSKTLLSFSFENEENVFNPGILTSEGVHTSLLPELSHRGPKAFKVIKIFESPMEIFPCSYGEDIRILDVPCLHFYPP